MIGLTAELKYTAIDAAKEIFEVEIGFDDLKISRQEIELSMGYSPGSTDKHFSDMIDEVILQIPKRSEIRAGYRIVDTEKPADRINGLYVGGVFFNTDKIVTGQLKKSNRTALFVVTIGTGMETWSRELITDGETVRGYIVDTTASAAVESVTDVLHDHIRGRMQEEGMNITNRYSPGYCLWQVSEQHLLFSLLPKNFLGVSLNDSALMQPIKSVSGIIGIGTKVRYKDYICDKCGVMDCTHRETRKK